MLKCKFHLSNSPSMKYVLIQWSNKGVGWLSDIWLIKFLYYLRYCIKLTIIVMVETVDVFLLLIWKGLYAFT